MLPYASSCCRKYHASVAKPCHLSGPQSARLESPMHEWCYSTYNKAYHGHATFYKFAILPGAAIASGGGDSMIR